MATFLHPAVTSAAFALPVLERFGLQCHAIESPGQHFRHALNLACFRSILADEHLLHDSLETLETLETLRVNTQEFLLWQDVPSIGCFRTSHCRDNQ